MLPEEILKFTLKEEGGFRLHKNKTEQDYTFAGIYKYANPDWEGWDYIKEGNYEKARELAIEFYNDIWKEIKGDHIPYKVAFALFDTAFHLYHRNAVRLLQKVLNKYWKMNLVEDGIIGKKTLSAIYRADENKLARYLLIERMVYYAKMSKKYNVYKRNWIHRTMRLEEKLFHLNKE